MNDWVTKRMIKSDEEKEKIWTRRKPKKEKGKMRKNEMEKKEQEENKEENGWKIRHKIYQQNKEEQE